MRPGSSVQNRILMSCWMFWKIDIINFVDISFIWSFFSFQTPSWWENAWWMTLGNSMLLFTVKFIYFVLPFLRNYLLIYMVDSNTVTIYLVKKRWWWEYYVSACHMDDSMRTLLPFYHHNLWNYHKHIPLVSWRLHLWFVC